MEKTVSNIDATETFKFKRLVLRVLIHCEGCRKKVTKVIKSIEGVYKTEVDALQHKVVVTGDFDANIVIQKLCKNGKQAEFLHESMPTAPMFDDMKDANQEKRRPASSSGKSKKNDKNKQEKAQTIEAHKKIPAEKMDENKNSSHQTNPAEKMVSGNKIHPNGEKLGTLTGVGLGGGDSGEGGNSSREVRMKPNKIAENGDDSGNISSEARMKPNNIGENGEGLVDNAPPPSVMPVHFPPNSNVVAPANYKEVKSSNTSSYPISRGGSAFDGPGHFAPNSYAVAPAKYTEVMSSNTSSYSTSNGGSAFQAPPAQQRSYAYSVPPANCYYPPPPSDYIRPPSTDHNEDYYDDDDDKIGCSIM